MGQYAYAFYCASSYSGTLHYGKLQWSSFEVFIDDFTKIEQKGVLALLSDSSNAEASYPNVSEQDIGNFVTNVFRNATGRIIVAAKASNLNRVQEVLNAAKANGKRVLLTGRIKSVCLPAQKLMRKPCRLT